jgi:DNA-binding LacI/PurR family transcriptional regulator
MPGVTLKDVAVRANVSYQTVSKVLNGKAKVAPDTAARIQQAVIELGYQPNISARNLRKQASNLIGYAWRRTVDGEPHPILEKFLYSAAEAAEARHFRILTFLIGSDADTLDLETYRDLYDCRQAEGFILDDTNYNDPRVAFLIDQKIPFASFGRANDDWEFCWVDVDGRAGLEAIVDHLVQRGHQRIGFISWPIGSRIGEEREKGYRRGLEKAGIGFDPALLVRGTNTFQAGIVGLSVLLNLPAERRPTAVACISDLIAIGAMNAAMAAGLNVGHDLAITGFDDLPLAKFLHPTLTTVRQPIDEVGAHIINLLVKQINGDPLTKKTLLLTPALIVRESS